MSLSHSRRQRGIEYRAAKAIEAEATRLAREVELARASLADEAIFAVNNYRRKDGTLVREHIRRGLPVIHSIYGSGFVRSEELLDTTRQMVNFYPTQAEGKRIAALFPVAKCALAIDRNHRNFPRYAEEIAIAVKMVEGLRLTWTR